MTKCISLPIREFKIFYIPIKFGSTLNKIAAAGSVKEGVARKTKEHVKEGVSASVTEENKCT